MLSRRQISRTAGLISALVATAGAVTSGCSSAAEDTEIGTTDQDLYMLMSNRWPIQDIPVCWQTTGNATEKAWVRQAMEGQRGWETMGDINLIGWGDCAAGATGIKVSGGDEMVTFALGPGSGGITTMELDFTTGVETRWGQCTTNGLNREECIKTVALHEFGHALAAAHEQNRTDTSSAAPSCRPCTTNAQCNANEYCEDGVCNQGTDGDTTYGNWDVASIMNYCGPAPEISGTDRTGFDWAYGLRDGGGFYKLGDSNADGRADLICHDAVDGRRWVDLANTSGQFGSTDWSTSTNWCGHASGRLYEGDFNGDGRQDLLCHDTVSGYKWIDYASSTGQYAGTNWDRNANWCAHEGAQIFIGDYNGDGFDDMLCHDQSTGYKWIDFADTSGQFNGTDWERDAGWCNHANGRLHIGDFNGDGRDDMLCHDLADGDKWIDYASSSGQFNGTNWQIDVDWCALAGAQLFVSDYNGDGRDDLLCHSVLSGYKWIDYASTSGEFGGTDWERNANWCNHDRGRLFVGDVNADGRDDLVCHDAGDGDKWIDYANSSGQFNGTDWSLAADWCSHDAGVLH